MFICTSSDSEADDISPPSSNTEEFPLSSISQNVRAPIASDRLIIDAIDVSWKFYEYQLFVLDRIKATTLTMERDIHHLLLVCCI